MPDQPQSKIALLLWLHALGTAVLHLALLAGLSLTVLAQLVPGPLLARFRQPILILLLLLALALSTLSGATLIAARRRHRQPAPSDPASGLSRRDFIKLAALETGISAAAVAAAGYVVRLEPRWLQVEHVQVPIAGLPPNLDGLRIVQLSDLHLSSAVPLRHIRQAAAMAQALAPDLILLTGDYVTESARDAHPCAAALSTLQAPLGVYAILGNHDHWTDPEEVTAALAGAGLTVLRNRGRPLSREPAGTPQLWLAGLDDVWERQADLDRALQDAPPGLPVLVAVHEPDYADQVAARARDPDHPILLQLSGHSHGGQVHLPLAGAPVLPYLGQKYPRGLRRVGSMWLYTNRGVGLIRPAVRINCPPEITLLTLRAQPGSL